MTKACEIAWFSALCDDDYQFLGVPDPRLQSSFEHCRDIVLQAESGGFDNILLPSGYALGIDTTAFASAMAVLTQRIKLLMALRMGEAWPAQLARQIATIDRMAGGRLAINIISSDLPGEALASGPRYQRTIEAMTILRSLLNGESVDHDGTFWKLKVEPPRISAVFPKMRVMQRQSALMFTSCGRTAWRLSRMSSAISQSARKARAARFASVIASMSWCAKRRLRRAKLQTGCFRNWTMRPALQFVRNHWTVNPWVFAVRPNCVSSRQMMAMSRTTSGPGSVGQGPDVALRSSAIRTRFWPN